MSDKQFPSLQKALSGLCFGLNQQGLDQLHANGVFTSYNLKQFADYVYSSWRMRNDAYLMRFCDSNNAFGFAYELTVESIEQVWEQYASKWIEKADQYFEKDYFSNDSIITFHYSKPLERNHQNLRGVLDFNGKRRLWDKTLIEAVLNKTLTFEVFKARMEHLEKLAVNHIKRHAKRFMLDQITDTRDPLNPKFIPFK